MITANRPSDGNPARIREEFIASGDAMAALAERTAQVDRLVLETAATLLFPAVNCEIAVLAVGGYGRRQLFPYSDIDVLLLFPSERQAMDSKAAISAFLQHLWDAGLRMSHSMASLVKRNLRWKSPAKACRSSTMSSSPRSASEGT